MPNWDKIRHDVQVHVDALAGAWKTSEVFAPEQHKAFTLEAVKQVKHLSRFMAGVAMLLARAGYALPAEIVAFLGTTQRKAIARGVEHPDEDYVCSMGFRHKVVELLADQDDVVAVITCPGCDEEVYRGRMRQDAVAACLAEDAHARECADLTAWYEQQRAARSGEQ